MKLPVVLLQLRLTHKQRIAACMMLEGNPFAVTMNYRELSRTVGLLLPVIKRVGQV